MMPFADFSASLEMNDDIFFTYPWALSERIFCITSTAGISKRMGKSFVPEGNNTMSYCCLRAKALKERLCHVCSAKAESPTETQMYLTPSTPDV